MIEKNEFTRRKGDGFGCASAEDCRFAEAVEKLEKKDIEIWTAINKRVPYLFFSIIVTIGIIVIGAIGVMARDSASKSDILNMQKDLMTQIGKIDERLYQQQNQMVTYYQQRTAIDLKK